MRSFGFGLLGALLLCGCDTAKERPIQFQGRVLLDGHPLDGATVTFIPRAPGGVRASDQTGREGNFQLTFDPNAGVVEGDYKVTVTLPAQPANEDQASEGKAHQENAKSAKESGIFRMRSWHPPLPARYGSEATTPIEQRIPPPGKVILLELHSS